MAGASGGVGFSELLDGELSVHILSLSLSDSSPLKLSFRLEGRVNEATKGLCSRVSEKYAAFGARILGLRKRSSKGLVSSVDMPIGEFEATLVLDEDGGRAKSVEEVGSDGLADDSAMISKQRIHKRMGTLKHESLQELVVQ
jgi:hypothetical protein